MGHQLDLEAPFSGISLHSKLVCEVFRVFARFESALKRAGFAEMRGEQLAVLRRRFARTLNMPLPDPLPEEIAYLVKKPPMLQVLNNGRLAWKQMDRAPVPLTMQWLLDAAYVVRNNLFHGGKTMSEPARDKMLLRAAEEVVRLALQSSPEVSQLYNEPL